jgi:hypothetical protein
MGAVMLATRLLRRRRTPLALTVWKQVSRMPRPWQTRSEYLVDLALESALAASPEELRVMRPVAAPQNPFPERRGFAKSEWNINEVMNIDRYNPTYRSWMSGMPVMPSVMSDQSWSGTARNSMSEGTW